MQKRITISTKHSLNEYSLCRISTVVITAMAGQAEGDTEVGFVSLFPLTVGYVMDMDSGAKPSKYMLTTNAELSISFMGFNLRWCHRTGWKCLSTLNGSILPLLYTKMPHLRVSAIPFFVIVTVPCALYSFFSNPSSKRDL